MTTAEYALFIGIVVMLAVGAMESLRERAFNTFDRSTAQVGTPIPGEDVEGLPGEPDPGPAYPGPGDPEPSDPEPSDPEPSDPEPSDPEPSDPGPSDPGPSDPTPPTFGKNPSCTSSRTCEATLDVAPGSTVTWTVDPSIGSTPQGHIFSKQFPYRALGSQTYSVVATVDPGALTLEFRIRCIGYLFGTSCEPLEI